MHTAQWKEYFDWSSKNLLRCPAENYRLLPGERKRIERSIRGFQLGEASEGRFLKAAAEAFAREAGNPDYPATIASLIREENRHSAYLGAFMRKQGIPTARTHWLDRAFRAVRRLCGLELNIRVLVTAELIALTYYECLGQATFSRELEAICARMGEEERAHVRYQMHHIHWINGRRFPLFGALADIGHALLLAATLAAVWLEHRPVLSIRHGFGSFFAKVWDDFREAMDQGRESAWQELERRHHEDQASL